MFGFGVVGGLCRRICLIYVFGFSGFWDLGCCCFDFADGFGNWVLFAEFSCFGVVFLFSVLNCRFRLATACWMFIGWICGVVSWFVFWGLVALWVYGYCLAAFLFLVGGVLFIAGCLICCIVLVLQSFLLKCYYFAIKLVVLGVCLGMDACFVLCVFVLMRFLWV